MKPPDNRQQNMRRFCAIFLPDVAKLVSVTTVVSTLFLLEPLAEKIFVITGNFPQGAINSTKIHFIDIGVKRRDNARPPMLISIPRFIVIQIKISYNLMKIAGKVDVVFLAAGAQALVLPVLLAKLLRKRVVLSHLGLGASSRKDYRVWYEGTLFGVGKYIFPRLIELLEGFNYYLSDRIITFLSDSASPLFRRYRNKISVSGSRFYVDTGSFKVARDVGSRENLVGYIGRFEKVKGIMDFVSAIPLVLRKSDAVKFMIGGDGSLRDEIEKEIKKVSPGNQVTLTGWIPHDKLPRYLNEIKLLVIPSYGETGPHMVFEAMACGTPVLAAPVGVIPAVIKDGETGFIMEENSPGCIARNILRALNNPGLDRIARAARELIEREYTYQAAVGRYRCILDSLR